MTTATDTGLSGWVTVRGSLWAAAIFCVALVLIYQNTAWSMVYIWTRSETFAHGFLILPISLWLVWTQRESLQGIRPRPACWVALLLLPLGFGWLLAWLVDVAVIQQFALVAMMITGAWAILGHRLGAVLAFPLFFLFFAVPVGEGLVAPMMEFTATSTVWLIELTGIPVYREGLYFNLPTGNWSVVEACSGVRYIIASVTVGVLYAYLTYRSWTRRILFVLVSAIVPIFANTVRAYMIVMLGHMSDMTVATGADHLVYGWAFFGVVIFVLFWLGGFFREDHLDTIPRVHAADNDERAGTTNGTLLLTLVSVLLLVAVAPLLAREVFGGGAAPMGSSLSLPPFEGGWRYDAEPQWSWRPASRVSGQESAFFQRGDDSLGIVVQFADGTIEGADVIGSNTLFTQEDSGWRVVGQSKEQVRGPDGEMLVDVAQIHGTDENLLAWSWYVVGDISTSNDYYAKIRQTLVRLGLSEAPTYRIIVVTPEDTLRSDAPEVLQRFVAEYVPLVYEALRQAEPAAH